MTDVARDGVPGACSDAWLYLPYRRGLGKPEQTNPQGLCGMAVVEGMGWGAAALQSVSTETYHGGRAAVKQSCLASERVVEEEARSRRDGGFY